MNAGKPGKRSAVDWDAIMQNPTVGEITTMTLPNEAERHDAQTDERLLEKLHDRADRMKYLFDLSMAEIDGGK